MKTKITEEGWTIIEGDLISGWVESEKNLMHDKFLPAVACANIPEGGVVIDCGANLGTHTVAYAEKVGERGTVIAIEAGKDAFFCLQENAKLFNGKVILINAAVMDVHGGRCKHTINEVNVGGSTVDQMQTKDEVTSNEVPTITIDGLVNDADIRRIDFIKIDCEGCEFKILQGAVNTLRRFKPKVMLEMNSFRLQEHGATAKDIYDWLLKQNYSWRIIQPEAKGGDVQFDIMCWPNAIETSSLVKAEKILPDALNGHREAN